MTIETALEALKQWEQGAMRPEFVPGHDFALMCAEVLRLRALMKEVEWAGATGRDSEPACPWCEVARSDQRSEPHIGCPAFMPDGEVR